MICYIHYCTKPCEQCWAAERRHRKGAIDVRPRVHHVTSFGEVVLEHMFHPWERPYPVTSREELRRECEQRGLYSTYLRESMGWHSGPRRWI